MQPIHTITLRGVRVHNLKSIDVDIPLDRLTVVVGVSGSGKSSLVFDTLHAEAQRRYVQSFSAYTRQFLERFDKPDADSIGDLPPAVAIRRVSIRANSRETVGSLTELGAQVRLLFARVGTLVCPDCRQPVTSHQSSDVTAALLALPTGTRATIAFPVLAPAPVEQAAWRAALLEEGYVRTKRGDQTFRLDESDAPVLATGEAIWILLDRVELGKTPVERMAESVDAAMRRGEGQLGILTDTNEFVFQRGHVCSRCRRVFPTPEPRLFDAHDPLGACLTCQGIGSVGKNREACSACQGARFNPAALAVRLNDASIADWLAQPCARLLESMRGLTLTDEARAPVAILIEAIQARLEAFVTVELGYLTLNQTAATLPDGVLRRIALTTALASSLVHVLYLIDEPTVGLHPRDTVKWIDALHRLRERGNTVVVSEHDHRVIEAADHVIELGLGAGDEGGAVVYRGPPVGLTSAPESPTSDFWTGRDAIAVPTQRRLPSSHLKLTDALAEYRFPLGVLCAVTGVSGAGKHRLVMETLYPTLARKKKSPLPSPLERGVGGEGEAPTAKVSGAEKLADVVLLDQQPLPRSSRSNPATLLKIFDDIRTLFADTTDAKIRNFGPGQFSFNQPGGRCDACEGQGTLTIDMQFLADVTTVCPECSGRRYRQEILDIKVRSRSIAEVLELTIREAFRFFRAQPAIEKKLKVLLDVGLEYLRLGQAVETLAGGECQRLKLAAHLTSSRKTGCLFILDEPSAGLHPADVANLLACFERLLSAGHSLLVIENDLDVIKCADWIIDLDHGHIVAEGTPEEVADIGESHTGRCLKPLLDG